MASLVIKELPDKIHARLKNAAQTHRRSVIQEAIVVLELGLMKQDKPLPAPKPIRGKKPLTDSFISQAISERRP